MRRVRDTLTQWGGKQYYKTNKTKHLLDIFD